MLIILVIRFFLVPSTWAVQFTLPCPLFYCSPLKSFSQKFLLLKKESDQLLLSSAAPVMASLLVKSHAASCLCLLTHGLLPLRLFPQPFTSSKLTGLLEPSLTNSAFLNHSYLFSISHSKGHECIKHA